MIILVSLRDKTIQDWTYSYDQNALANSDTYISDNMLGKHIEIANAGMKYDVVDLDDTKIPRDENGVETIDYMPNKYKYINGNIVINANYIDTDLEKVRKAKINEMKKICGDRITAGLVFNIDGEEKVFTFKITDQLNLNRARIKLMDKTVTSVNYGSGDAYDETWSANDFKNIWQDLDENAESILDKCRRLVDWIGKENDPAVLNKITFDSELPEEFA